MSIWGSGSSIENIFNDIGFDVSKVVVNFDGVEFMGRSSAQVYLNIKYSSKFEIVEINISWELNNLFNIILDQNSLL